MHFKVVRNKKIENFDHQELFLLVMKLCTVIKLGDTYSGFPRIRNHFLGYSLLFLNNSLLFYPLFNMKIEICFLYKGVSYSRNPAVAKTEVEIFVTVIVAIVTV